MIKYKIEFFVGVFISLGILSILILILQISGIKTIYNKEETYKITASFKNIGNLREKAKVTIGGVKIGTVNKIELNYNSSEYIPQVEMFINCKVKNIPIDSIASIIMSSLLGDSYIQIEPGNEDLFLNNGDAIKLTTQALIIEELLSKFAFSK
ncbi:MAG TPA: outer membrane lipid asymmetry maintenance protein MlaD [Candidatus Azoamicus sp. OHIO1]